MNYRELNEYHRNKMNSIRNIHYKMEWKEPEFMGYLLGGFPKFRKPNNDRDLYKKSNELEKTLLEYNAFLSNKKLFLEKVSEILSQIKQKSTNWYGIGIHEIEACVKMHSFCIISGEGGVGKSYFIKCFENELESKKIKHLCLYGKFEKTLESIDLQEIINASEDGFVFVFDAVNEMTEKGQRELLVILKELKKYPKIRIVLTYRTNSMNDNMVKEFQKLSKYEKRFQGVSFESALSEMLKLSIPNVYMYEDILYSNNALLLGMLCDVLSSHKIIKAKENGIASITFILEQYIKKSITRTFGNDKTFSAIEIWKDTKRIADWMYRNNSKNINKSTLLSLIRTKEFFLTSMIQLGFLDFFESENKIEYFFTIDSLTDFLLARSLFEDMKRKTDAELIEILRNKLAIMTSLREAVLILLFDKFSPDYERIREIIVNINLEYMLYETIPKIHFKENDIVKFQKLFKPNNKDILLNITGGYTAKPFNCSNFLFEYYCTEVEKCRELSDLLREYRALDSIKNRLKNVLYFITLNKEGNQRQEAFYLSLLCCSSSNKDIRVLAMKVLYEILSDNDIFLNKVIFEFDRIGDFYIQESIINVISQLRRNNSLIIDFFNRIRINHNNLTAKSVFRISSYLGDPYDFINWNRKNLYQYNDKAMISDYLNDILHNVDWMNKDFLPFKYFSRDKIEISKPFLAEDKNTIKQLNEYLCEKYECIDGGECSGWGGLETSLKEEILRFSNLEILDKNSFLECFEKVLKSIFDFYHLPANRNSVSYNEDFFQNSLYMKCVDIAVGIYYGSLMCNYYIDDFISFNSDHNIIGYDVYNPYYLCEEIYVTTPISIYQDFIEALGDLVSNRVQLPVKFDKKWLHDAKLTRENLLTLIQEIEYKKETWVLLSGRVFLQGDQEEFMDRWQDKYIIYCCTSEKETIENDGNARYLTIEAEDYSRSLEDYIINDYKPWLCKELNNICSGSEVFDKTSLVLPPSEMIKFFNLSLNISDMSWENEFEEKIIICNNNKNSFYEDVVGRTIFIKKRHLETFLENNSLKYFAFSERYVAEEGFSDNTSLHFEIMDGKIIKEIKNRRRNNNVGKAVKAKCLECPYGKYKEDDTEDLICINDILKEYQSEN